MSLQSKAAIIAERTRRRELLAAGEDPTRIDMILDGEYRDPRLQRLQGYAAHGNTPFDMPVITNVVGDLWQGGTVTGLVLPDTIEHLVSLYPWERYTVDHQLKTEQYVEMLDSTAQSLDLVDEIAAAVLDYVADGPTLVVCQAGLNRSGLIAARVLMLGGMTADAAIRLLRERRTPAVLCNPAFEQWLRAHDQED